MGKEEVKDSINDLILESGLSYGDVVDILKFIIADYLQKGNDLLNNADIQKVVKESKV